MHGSYESFYLKAADPLTPRAVWIRHTTLRRPGGPERASLWCTLWDGGEPVAWKHTYGEARRGDGALIGIDAASLTPRRAQGRLDGAEWDIAIAAGEEPFAHLPYAWMYRRSLPRTKSVSLHPRALLSGEARIGEHVLRFDGWPGMLGHNWGSEHAERWIWLQCAGFDQQPDAWIDMTIGRVRLGGVSTPWIANGCLSIGGRRRRLGGLAAIRSTLVSAAPERASIALPGFQCTVEAPRERLVAWRYADPPGGEHLVTNCSASAIQIDVGGDALHAQAGAAYELGGREDPPVALQPFPDP
jgi:hypothetical protein